MQFPSLRLASGENILRKEDKTMTYTKPAVEVLGNASALIETINGKPGNPGEPVGSFNAPAYDLDE